MLEDGLVFGGADGQRLEQGLAWAGQVAFLGFLRAQDGGHEPQVVNSLRVILLRVGKVHHSRSLGANGQATAGGRNLLPLGFLGLDSGLDARLFLLDALGFGLGRSLLSRFPLVQQGNQLFVSHVRYLRSGLLGFSAPRYGNRACGPCGVSLWRRVCFSHIGQR